MVAMARSQARRVPKRPRAGRRRRLHVAIRAERATVLQRRSQARRVLRARSNGEAKPAACSVRGGGSSHHVAGSEADGDNAKTSTEASGDSGGSRNKREASASGEGEVKPAWPRRRWRGRWRPRRGEQTSESHGKAKQLRAR